MQRKILAICTGTLVNRGVESYLINLYNNINHNEISMDFLTPCVCKNEQMRSMVIKHDNKIYELNIANNKYSFLFNFYTGIIKFLEKHEYDTVYINTGNVLPMSIASLAACRSKINRIIVHAHNGGILNIKNRIIKIITTPIMERIPTDYFTCSKLAAEYVFPQNKVTNAVFIPNGIELSKFEYKEELRNEVRDKYGLGDAYLIGNVGAFIPQKNHSFIIDIFLKVHNLNPSAKLVLIGEGPNCAEIKEKVEKMGLKQNVIFTGRTDDISKWLSAMDLFIMPSKYEGLPVSVIEAQASGLKCILSDSITEEVNCSDIIYLSTENNTDVWVEEIMRNRFKQSNRNNVSTQLEAFDIKHSARRVEQLLL